jgi:SPP1 gp7 family putative phage head morphogenesis protein
MAGTVNSQQRRDMIAAFRKGAGVDLSRLATAAGPLVGRSLDGGAAVTLDRAIQTNVELIKSIPSEHLDKVRRAIDAGLTRGLDGSGLRAEILKIEGVTNSRAKLIARDQTQKLTAALNQSRQQSIGIDTYTWRASRDGRVRESHAANDGKVFRWDSPPPETGHPGEDVNCRCTAESNIESLLIDLGI